MPSPSFDLTGKTAFLTGASRGLGKGFALTLARALVRRTTEPTLIDGPGTRKVIATGGGAFVNPETRALILDKAIAVWLDTDIEVLVDRVGRKDTRPLLRGGDPREISMNGVPSDNVPVTIGGFSLATSEVSGTGRNVELNAVSINNLSRIEAVYSPTPESPGSALAGSVNLVPRSSFERVRPSGNFNAYFMLRDDIKHWGKTPAPRHPTRKIHPGFDLSYIAPVNKRFGFTLSAGINRQYSGEPQIQNLWRGTQTATNGTTYPHTTFDKPYLWSTSIRNSGKPKKA